MEKGEVYSKYKFQMWLIKRFIPRNWGGNYSTMMPMSKYNKTYRGKALFNNKEGLTVYPSVSLQFF